MPDYSRGKIYALVCNETGEQYIGSTTQSLSQRLSLHTYMTKNGINGCKSKQILERGNYSIVLIEEYACENKNQLERRERHFIETMVCVNKIIPTRTKQEYINDNQYFIIERHSNYYQKNKTKLNEKSLKNYYENIEKKRNYYQKNKDKLNEYQRKRRANKKLQSTPPLLPSVSTHTVAASELSVPYFLHPLAFPREECCRRIFP
jgi:hypothetical protein